MHHVPDCLRNLVGFRGCDDTSAPFLFYLDDLHGFSPNLIAGIAPSHTPVVKKFADRLVAQGTDLVLSDLKEQIARNFSVKDQLETILPTNWAQTHAPVNGLRRGIRIVRNSACGKLACLWIESLVVGVASNHPVLEIQIEEDANVTSYVVDNVVAYTPFKVPLDLTSQASTIRITLPANAIPLTLKGGSGCRCGGNQGSGPRCFRVRGWNGLAEDDMLYGVQIAGAVNCCLDYLFCTWKKQIADLVRWRAGAILATEGFVTDRINAETLSTDRLSTLHEMWMEEYNKRLRVWGEGVKLTISQLNEQCITCNKTSYTYGY